MICGVDEAGRGPVIGPLVVAGVNFRDESRVMRLKVKDSKQLSPQRREILAKEIKEFASNYEVLIISAKDIDDMRKVMTLNEIEVNAFTTVIKKLKPEICYVDSADVNQTIEFTVVSDFPWIILLLLLVLVFLSVVTVFLLYRRKH